MKRGDEMDQGKDAPAGAPAATWASISHISSGVLRILWLVPSTSHIIASTWLQVLRTCWELGHGAAQPSTSTSIYNPLSPLVLGATQGDGCIVESRILASLFLSSDFILCFFVLFFTS